ncbi:MAG: diadenylate cyclase CdaA [Candidatus Gastranaerophilales bacterium]|nr:diadenylate cyclase CdaA [Candidatus Gastranaerophilales bacterium]
MEFSTLIHQYFLRPLHDFALQSTSLTFDAQMIVNIFEILFLTGVLVFTYRKFIKGTHSESLVRGLFVLLIMWGFSEFLIRINIQIIGVFIKMLVTFITVSLIVIFQPEMRRFLGYIGQNDFFVNMFFNKQTYSKTSNEINTVKELIESIKYLSKNKIGALMVLKSKGEPLNHNDVGTKLDAILSQELLLTIFHPNTPLHDGAVILNKDKILYAGALLPLTEDPKLSWRYGTRHRAAIGITEISDCACLVVSEETGDVSIASGGNLKKYEDLGALRADLERILGYAKNDDDKKQYIFKFENILPSKYH